MSALVPLDCSGMETLVPHTPYKRVCGQCGGVATRLCDYRPCGDLGLPCDMLLCDECANSPMPGKDHCAGHARIWNFRAGMRALARKAG